MPGHLALILHAHLPFVRHPEHEHFLEEDWFFEAITESYIPLLRMMQRLVDEHVPFKLTMSLTPTLCAMLQDELLCERYVRHLDLLIDLATVNGNEIAIIRSSASSQTFISKSFAKPDASLSMNANAICLPLFANCGNAARLKSLPRPPRMACFPCSRAGCSRGR